jgi:Flp pilus assembly protein TadD
MLPAENPLAECTALVIEGNPTSRAILVSHLRDLGIPTIVQAARPSDGRRKLEYQTFDFVLCELHFAEESSSGQDLLDDLRRSQLLPFSTIFIMITGEATYSKVAEAAESALDGYLLKPHKASQLWDRLHAARQRKLSFQEVFAAIDEEQFEQAARLCMERFESKGPFWLYAARIGAELLLRIEKYDDAQTLYQAVVEAKTLPWAKLGVARAQLESGQVSHAATLLERLIGEDPTFADAYDVMGRAQFELGNFDRALETYKMAAMLTPASISRLQNMAVMTYYHGDHAVAETLLDRTVRLGLDSKMFDFQSLVLLSFSRLELDDKKGLQRCLDDFDRLAERYPDNPRLQRLTGIAQALQLIATGQFSESVDTVRRLALDVRKAEFDYESASNLLALMAQLAHKAIRLEEVDAVVDTIGLRFCSNRSLTELLASCVLAHPAYAERLRAAQTKVLGLAEEAIRISVGGKPTQAIRNLLDHGASTLNARLIDNAYQLLLKYTATVDEAAQLGKEVNALRSRFGMGGIKASMTAQKRQAGSLALRTSA